MGWYGCDILLHPPHGSNSAHSDLGLSNNIYPENSFKNDAVVVDVQEWLLSLDTTVFKEDM